MRGWNKGFTLIELIIFIIVVGIFVPFTYIAFSSGLRGGMNPETVTTARFVAEQAAELAAKRGWNTLCSDIGTGNASTGSVLCATSLSMTVPSGYSCYWTASYRTFNGTTFSTVSAPPPTPLPNYVLVAVTVTPPQGGNFATNMLVTNHAY
jgi:prepilin-type N-terminal cleavage/methylation domain-containing protein